jgi:BirA family biotin operon repressor/biotin-[acetyl-CoA-carboxylase] ligase
LKTAYRVDIGDVLKRVLKFLEVYLDRLSDVDAAGLNAEYEALLFQKGKMSTFKDQKETFQGVIKGVTESGFLKIQKNSGETSDYPHGAIEMIF